MKVSKLLAHRIHTELQIAIALIENEQGARAMKVLEALDELVSNQTVETVDNCEKCGFRQRTLDQKSEAGTG